MSHLKITPFSRIIRLIICPKVFNVRNYIIDALEEVSSEAISSTNDSEAPLADHTLAAEPKERAISLPQTCNSASLSMLKVDSNLTSRISKSTECLSTILPEPEASCMMVPESLSLEDIFAYNQRLSNPPEDIHKCTIKKKLYNRLKMLK